MTPGQLRIAFSAIRSSAYARGLSFDLSYSDVVRLIKQPCRYCGDDRGLRRGLDRMDSSLGYTLDNVVPACVDCNNAKSDVFTFEEMLVIGRAIAAVKAQWPRDKPRPARRRRQPSPPHDLADWAPIPGRPQF